MRPPGDNASGYDGPRGRKPRGTAGGLAQSSHFPHPLSIGASPGMFLEEGQSPVWPSVLSVFTEGDLADVLYSSVFLSSLLRQVHKVLGEPSSSLCVSPSLTSRTGPDHNPGRRAGIRSRADTNRCSNPHPRPVFPARPGRNLDSCVRTPDWGNQLSNPLIPLDPILGKRGPYTRINLPRRNSFSDFPR